MVSKNKIVYTVSTVLMVLLIYVLLSPLMKVGARGNGVDLTEIPELFVRSIHGLNRSTHVLEKSLEEEIGEANIRELIGGLEEVTDRLLNLSKYHYLGGGELGERLRRASHSYRIVSLSATYVGNASLEVNKARSDIEYAFDLLLDCKIYDALSYWKKAKPHIVKAREELSRALLDLSKVNQEDLLSEKHREIFNICIEKITSISLVLEELTKLFNIIEEYPEAIKELCEASNTGREPQIPGDMKEKLAKALGSLSPSKGGEYGYEISRIKSLLKLLEKQPGSNGSGAGYGAPSSDD